TVPVHLQRGGETLMTEPVALPEGSTERQVTLNYTPTEPGLFALTARVAPGEDDRTSMNDAQIFRMRVDAEPIRVLYIEGVLRPEAKFLRRRLDADPDVDLISFTRAANPQRAGAAGALVGGELVSDDRLERIDVVLLGDFEARMLDEQAYDRLRTWVENGGGLMVLGGYHNLGSAGLGTTALNAVLPLRIDDNSVQQLDESFAFTLTEEGQRHPALTVTGDRLRDARLWQELPTLRGIVAVGGARAGATVLARHPRPNPNDDEQRGYPVLAVQRFGEGTSAVLTADTTWRWSRLMRLAGQPDTMYVRFWSQMVRWLAQREDPTAQTALTLSTDRASYERGQRVPITVQRNPAAVIPGSDNARPELRLTVRRPDGRRTTLNPQRSSSDSHRWTASYFPDRGGRYQLEASLARPGGDTTATIANQTTEFLVEGSDLELSDPATDPTAMRQIARLTGGLYADIDQDETIAQLVAGLPTEPRVTQRVQRSAVWHSPGLFIAFLVLMCAEWIIRRQHQLV
ncbi:MAG: glutamine amidotransferase, partial [Phycisphaeraceae bacterium]